MPSKIDIDFIDDWAALKAQLQAVKNKEMKQRREIISFLLKGKETGRVKKELFGLNLHAEIPPKLTIDADVLQSNWESLSQEEKNVIKFTPSVQKRLYNKLENRSTLDEAVIVKPGSPVLKIIDKK